MTAETLELAEKMDALNLWGALKERNWALKPLGTVMPYFCTARPVDDEAGVRARLLFIEGWQTFHCFVASCADRWFGYYTSPMEIAHYELIIFTDGRKFLARYDPGFVPREPTLEEESFLRRLMWQAYGVMMRLESSKELIMKYSSEMALFARVETKSGQWEDAPMKIPPFHPIIDRISIPKKVADAVKDLPIVEDFIIASEMKILQGVSSRGNRPKLCYAFVAIDAKSKTRLFRELMSINDVQSGVKGLWESLAGRMFDWFLKSGKVPSEIQLLSGRLFRYLRPVCMTLPIKLSLHDRIDALAEAFDTSDLKL